MTLVEPEPLLRRLGGGDRDARPRLDRAPRSRTTARCASTTSRARYGVLTLAGPRSRELLQRAVARRRLARGVPASSARGTSRSAGLPSLALRVSYVGELGFELHHPLEHQRDAVRPRCSRRASRSASSTSATARSTRCGSRRRYRLWGADMSADWTPLEAGLERFVALRQGRLRRPRRAPAPARGRARRHARLPDRRVRRRRRPRLRAGLRRRRRRSATSPPAATATRSSRVIALAYLPVEHAGAGHAS